MADKDQRFTLQGKHAFNEKVDGVVYVDLKVTKPYIWIMKLRYIWAVIRAKVGE